MRGIDPKIRETLILVKLAWTMEGLGPRVNPFRRFRLDMITHATSPRGTVMCAAKSTTDSATRAR